MFAVLNGGYLKVWEFITPYQFPSLSRSGRYVFAVIKTHNFCSYPPVPVTFRCRWGV
jgi:hypothetical protein